MYRQNSRSPYTTAAFGQKMPRKQNGRDRQQSDTAPLPLGHSHKWMQAAQAAEQHIVLLYAPLPPLVGQPLADLCDYLQKAMLPWLGPQQLAHLQAFHTGDAALKARCSRLLARALLVRLVMGATQATLGKQEKADALSFSAMLNHPSLSCLGFTGLGMDHQGRPALPGWRIAFSHSGMAAFCAVRRQKNEQANVLCQLMHDSDKVAQPRVENLPCLAVDAEALVSLPPAGRAFTARETRAPLAEEFHARERLRRWTVKEALLKAAGLGLSRDPYLIHSGRYGQRRGLAQFYHKGDTFHSHAGDNAEISAPYRNISWQLVPCAGHWVCVATPVQPDQATRVVERPMRAHWRTILAELPLG